MKKEQQIEKKQEYNWVESNEYTYQEDRITPVVTICVEILTRNSFC